MTERVNIPQSVKDPHYRYKMPKMQLKEESRLNGVKTNIRNLTDVAQALRVPGSCIIKFFCAEVGANQVQDTIIMGSHNADHLDRLLDKFITKYVLCSKCKYPELTLEVVKKDLTSVCNACGAKGKLDVLHKAGKQLFKEVPTLYKLNPEFSRGNQKQSGVTMPDEPGSKAGSRPGTKGGKGKKHRQTEVEIAKQKEEEIEKKVEKHQKDGTEITMFDCKEIAFDSEEMNQACDQINLLISEQNEISADALLKQARSIQLRLNLTPDYKYYILMCGIFNPQRSPVKHWATFEQCFGRLAAIDKEVGHKRVFQAITHLFKRHPDIKNQAATLCKLTYESGFFTDAFFTQWSEKKLKLDKTCCLYDRKAEKEMRGLLTDFIGWLTTAEYGEYDDEEDKDKEETKVEETEEESSHKKEETEQERQRRMIAEQMELQHAKAQMQVEEHKRAMQQEEEKTETTGGDIANVDIDDDFDIDDI